MLRTRMLNQWLGTSYHLEEVAEMDPIAFEILNALHSGLFPPEPKMEKAKP